MRKMIVRFPEIVMIDATHCTNAENFKLFSFMVVDAFGSSQFVQQAFVGNERKESLATVMQHFKQSNPVWEEVKWLTRTLQISLSFVRNSRLRSFSCANSTL